MPGLFELWNRKKRRDSTLSSETMLACSRNDPSLTRAATAEFIGTFVLVAIGNGSVAQSLLTNGEKGNYFTLNWGWGIGCFLGILISAKTSGGHINPAVTMALAMTKEFPWNRLPAYWCAQYLGALAASCTVLAAYYEAIMDGKVNGEFRIHKDPSDPGSAAIFANYPAPYSSASAGLMEEILSTVIFMLVIRVVTAKQSKVPSFLQPLYIGFTLLAIGLSYGSNGGYALNPARDFAPRVVTLFAGWGIHVFSIRGYNWFWIYLVGPHIGAILGVIIFNLFLKQDRTIDDTRSESPSVDLENGYGKELDVIWRMNENRDIESDMNKLDKENPPRYSVAYANSRPQLGRGLSCPVATTSR
ncbi:aquaporin-9-like [Daphnia carinata]|uniref:aquaporin-9-like n=1 Tax=Daphnia carinata TaxID=120202 RepID=UPI00257F1977|nr:aquaporin-9-like [Daphnia carinata]XP_057370630.1 aquaporin-9-like [Daphnia carinata]